ncbi:putative endoribonuclease L-PSP [Facklamia languida CCUG 37842]|uniref:Putative endoribonuclease L-PSP n=1 Tax=Facklamia languida CCUG 37842 TaxID=883113 RepID=H3NH03_9LACT|nr:putative endoribonuclease L-PSP [Facklamia languida CCUG 37842]
MSEIKTITTDQAPAAIGPYSQAKVINEMVFCSGQIPIDPATNAVEATDIEGQTQQVLKNVDALLQAAGSSADKVIKTTCFLADMADFAVFNELYGQYFTSKPARSAVAVKTLPKNVLVEIEVIASL